MPFEQYLEEHVLYVKYTGEVTFKCIIESDEVMLANRKFENLAYLISDFTNIKNLKLDGINMGKVVHNSRTLANWEKKLNLAIVVKSEDEHLAQEWAKLVYSLGLTWNTQIFNDIISARNWIESLD